MLVVRPGISCDQVFFLQAPKYTIVYPEKKNAWSQVRNANIFYLVLCLVILTEESVSFSFVFIQLILRQLN